MTTLAEYWDQRAREFAAKGTGLRAVCSYGMPSFYNGYIDITQRLALSKHLRVRPETSALDIGCGIGRWSRRLVRQGAHVTAVDVAPAMIAEARRRTEETDRIDYAVADIRKLDLGRQFDLVLTVTVLQHILEESEFHSAVRNVARHLAPAGRAVLLEAAPSRPNDKCDTHVFRARSAEEMIVAFQGAGLRVRQVSGVDPAPFKQHILPRYRKMPRLAAQSAMFAATALSLPWDVILGRRLTGASWHKVFVLDRDA